MYGDRSRKENLVEYGLPTSCSDGQSTVKIDEFEAMQNQVICVSNSCGLRITKNRGVVVEQVIRPTGLLDPVMKSDQV
jgi:excinuclease ABC subunit B